jgi:hypothetical protein
MVSRYLSAPDQRQDRHLPARSRASPSNWRGSARPLSAAPGGPSILSPVRPDQIVGVLIGRHRRDRGYAHHGRGGRSPNSPIRPTSRGTEVNGELRGQHAWVFWCSRSSDTFSNFFCEEALRGCTYTAGLCISIQRYSYRYRYRMLIGQPAGDRHSLRRTDFHWPEVPQGAGP